MGSSDSKRVLIDLQHPAHLHFFRPVAEELRRRGHEVLFTARDKDILLELAREMGEELTVFGTAGQGFVSLSRELVYRWWKLGGVMRRFKPDVMLAIAGTFIAFPGWLKRVPAFVFYDTEHATLSNLLAYPFAKCVYVPQCYRDEIRWAHQRYNGYHELSYLHPDRFTPDASVLAEAGLEEGERFSLVRYVGWSAGHDIGRSGFSIANRVEAIKQLAEYGRVLLSAEGGIPAELEKYRVSVPVHRVHHLMSFASLIFGESATMCSEGAVLGVPGVYVDPIGRGYTDEQGAEYDLVHWFTSNQQDEAIARAVTVMENDEKAVLASAHQRMLSEKIDVCRLVVDVAEGRTAEETA